MPVVETEDIWKSASVPPSQVASMLLSPQQEQSVGGDPLGGSHILRDVVELLKGSSGASVEATRHSPARLPRYKTPLMMGTLTKVKALQSGHCCEYQVANDWRSSHCDGDSHIVWPLLGWFRASHR